MNGANAIGVNMHVDIVGGLPYTLPHLQGRWVGMQKGGVVSFTKFTTTFRLSNLPHIFACWDIILTLALLAPAPMQSFRVDRSTTFSRDSRPERPAASPNDC